MLRYTFDMDLSEVSYVMQGSRKDYMPSAHNHDPIGSSFDGTGMWAAILPGVAAEVFSTLVVVIAPLISELPLLVILSTLGPTRRVSPLAAPF